MSPRRVAVLGGGISGLAAAQRCRDIARERGIDLEITVLERSERAGGCIETRVREGVVAELGPDSIVTEKPAALDLARRLNLGDDIAPMRPEYRGARIVRGGRLLPIPDDFRLFAPTTIAGMVRSGLFGPVGVVRAALEVRIDAPSSRSSAAIMLPKPPRRLTSRCSGCACGCARAAARIPRTMLPYLRSSISIIGSVACIERRRGSPE